MKLSELKKQIDEITKLAKKANVNPEVRCAVLPKFPSSISLQSLVLASLKDDFSIDTTDGHHIVYLAEKNEIGAIVEEVTTGFGWGLSALKKRLDETVKKFNGTNEFGTIKQNKRLADIVLLSKEIKEEELKSD